MDISNRNVGFRAPNTFIEKVSAFCEANDLTPSQVYRRGTLAYIENLSGPKPQHSVKSRTLTPAE